MWVLTLNEFIKVLSRDNREIGATPSHLQTLVVHEPLVQVLSAILSLSISTNKQIPETLISTCGLQELDDILNSMKTDIIKLLSKVADSLKDPNLAANVEQNRFFIYAQTYAVPLVLNNLIVFCKNEEIINHTIERVLAIDRDIYEHIWESLSFLTKMITYPDLQPLYAGVTKTLVMDVCFPLIKTSKEDLDEFGEQPDQFVTAALNTVSLIPQTPKTQAAKLLERLCTNIDEALSYAVSIILCTIEYSLISDKIEDIPINFKNLEEYMGSEFITKTDPTIRIETCLFILTILSQSIGRRNDLIVILEEFFKTYQGFFLGEKSNPIIKARICLLFAFYAHLLFQGDEKKDLYAIHLRFLLECVGADDLESEGLSENATHSLYNILEREHLKPILEPFVPDLLGKLESFVLTTKAPKVFDIIYEIVASYDDKLLEYPNQLIGLLNTLVRRGEQECEIIRQDRRVRKITLNKVWNVIRIIAEKEKYVLLFQEDLEKALIPLFRYLENNVDFDFDEDILHCIADITKTTKKVSPTIWEIFRFFPNISERYEGMISCIFPALNHIIVYGHDVINSDSATVKILVEMGIQALNCTHNNADEASFSEGALLLQLIYQYLSPISNNLFENILQAIVDKLENAENDFLKARLGGVILCAFIKNFEITQKILQNMNQLTNIMNLFLEEVLIFETHSYDRKLLVIGLSNILVQSNLNEEISSRLLEIFDTVISILSYIKYMNMKRSEAQANMNCDDADGDSEKEQKTSDKTILKKFLDSQELIAIDEHEEDKHEEEEEDDDDDEDDEAEDDAYVLGKSEANSVVKYFETELKQKDEFAVFKQAFITIKEANLVGLRELVDRLSPTKRDFLKDLLQSQIEETHNDLLLDIVESKRKESC